MRNGNLLQSRVSEICVKRIRFNQGVGVLKYISAHGNSFNLPEHKYSFIVHGIYNFVNM